MKVYNLIRTISNRKKFNKQIKPLVKNKNWMSLINKTNKKSFLLTESAKQISKVLTAMVVLLLGLKSLI